jgi:HEAT repeat protein
VGIMTTENILTWIAEKRNDPRTNEELIKLARARTDEGDDPGWDAIAVLHARGTRDIFDAACQLLRSEIPSEREVGADILGQLGIPERTFPEETLRILLALLEQEQDVGVLQSIAVALGHLHDGRAVEPLLKLKRHPDTNVRHALVFALGGHEDELAIAALIELSSDESAIVRDWATFGLGSLIDMDTPEIRDALVARLDDEDVGARDEALVGLASRKDQRVVERLLHEFESGQRDSLLFEAACEIADSRLYPALMRIRDEATDLTDYEKEWLEEAISKCKR